MARPDAPFRLDTYTPEQARRDGREAGRTWTLSWRPGGPWVPRVESWERDAEWIDYCQRKAACNRAYLEGFDEGRTEQN
jgi:hypothetical protein